MKVVQVLKYKFKGLRDLNTHLVELQSANYDNVILSVTIAGNIATIVARLDMAEVIN